MENGAVSWINCSLPISASVSTVKEKFYVSALKALRGGQPRRRRKKGKKRRRHRGGGEKKTERESDRERERKTGRSIPKKQTQRGANFLPLFLLKEIEAFVPHDREARTREERPFSGFIKAREGHR